MHITPSKFFYHSFDFIYYRNICPYWRNNLFLKKLSKTVITADERMEDFLA